MKVTVIGTGYVGLVAGVCFADAGHTVVCVDVDERKVERLKKGEIPIYEPGLADILQRASQRVSFTTNLDLALEQTDVAFIAVGTPERPDGSADLAPTQLAVEAVAKSKAAAQNLIVVLKSTVPIGTAEVLRQQLDALGRTQFEIVSNPEFLKEGAAIDDFMRPDRVVIGCKSERAREAMSELYEPFVRHGAPVLFMDNASAEMTKYAANAFLSVKISFINELALLADKVGADIDEVRRGFTSDRRINPAFFQPGVGFGGSCFPKDVRALVHTGTAYGLNMSVVEAADQANDRQKSVLFDQLQNHFAARGRSLNGLTIAVWGLAFKPDTDDVREAPALELIAKLVQSGCQVRAYDPVATETARLQLPADVEFCRSSLEAVKAADALMVVTDWNEFKNPNWVNVKSTMRSPVVLDGRNVYDPEKMAQLGFDYHCIGRQVRYSRQRSDKKSVGQKSDLDLASSPTLSVAVVAGASGFLGSHLADLLLKKNRLVIGIDSLVTGRIENVAHLNDTPHRFQLVLADICDAGLNAKVQEQLSLLAQLNGRSLRDVRITEVYNMASPASPVDFNRIPVEILETASMGHRRLLDLAHLHSARCLFASSSEVYGDAEKHPQSEDYFGNVNTIGHRSCYDEAKRYGEALSVAHAKKFGTKIRLARIFNTYGPRMRPDDGRIIPNFFIQALQRLPLTVYGTGQQTRSLCYVDDLVGGLVTLMESNESRPVNIGGSHEQTALEIAHAINELTGNSAPIRFMPLPENDPKMRKADTTRAKALGWSQNVSLNDGLKATAAYFRSELERSKAEGRELKGAHPF